MAKDADRSLTGLLAQWKEGNEAALGELTSLVYQELRSLAQSHLRRERPDHTIQRTALVHEAFVRLAKEQSIDWTGRGHFFALASNIMRRILVDHARARRAAKRGGGSGVVSLDEAVPFKDSLEGELDLPQQVIAGWQPPPGELTDDISAVDEALNRLAILDPRQAQIVEMRYFGGLTVEETAEALGVSTPTVKREWSLARLWLHRELSRDD